MMVGASGTRLPFSGSRRDNDNYAAAARVSGQPVFDERQEGEKVAFRCFNAIKAAWQENYFPKINGLIVDFPQLLDPPQANRGFSPYEDHLQIRDSSNGRFSGSPPLE
jgi:hypothetical protein